MQYTSHESLEDKSWADLCAWESYGWRLAANAVRMATEAERDELKRRIDAVLEIVGLEQQGEFEEWPAGEHIHALRDVRAIAEGRDNG